LVNSIGLWPAQFQSAANLLHGMAAALPNFEVGLVLVPLAIHVALGLRALRREGLKMGVEKQQHGSDARYWLQRVTAVILLVFLAFHLSTMHRWGGHLAYQITHWPALGRFAGGPLFNPHSAFASVSGAVSLFWDDHAANPANLLIAEFYLLGIASAVYHMVNGFATGAEVMGLVSTKRQKRQLEHGCMVAGIILTAIGLAAWYAFTARAAR